MIVDVHAHLGPWFFAMDVGAVGTNLSLMDKYGITVQIVSSTEAVVYDAPAGNRALATVLAGTPRLLGYVVVNPNHLAAAERDLAEYLPTGRFVGVKIHTTYPGRPIASAAMRDALALVAQAGVPALVHTWGDDVFALLDHLEAEPALRVVAGHMGGPAWRSGAEAAARCDRMYLEPCCSITDAGKLRYALDRVPVRQFLFGTDATLIDPAVSLGVVADARLDPTEHEHLMWRNAVELFRLPGPDQP
ncbi:amidohydrolase family protein [Phytohabitans kaempferiae]|uniref:Amidohydrolase family protein n=1 Tax=Phytohabitans kaempferiae TaxID=1620943 RepID=A0ABV6MCG3_9ACTN